MPTRGAFVRSGCHFPLGFAVALCTILLLSGCGGGDTSKPAPVDQAQMKKAQEYLGSYREQMVAANKAQSKAKAKPAEKPAK